MAESVGQISLDLVLGSQQFKSELNKTVNNSLKDLNKNVGNTLNKSVGNNLKQSFAGIGKVVAGAFVVKKIAEFTASCLQLGSDLAEVQNVVDVSFSTMSESVNSFAKTAITQFGMSETITKKYVGTFGAMAKAFGFTEQQAYEMSTTLTGLAGDVASFYNLSSDEAYTKLKSVFTGETESLKDLGVVMTQTALDQYALANGYGKTTAKMTEQEKTALRYKFVLEQLSLANGDFARTSDSWANQTRVLGLQFEQFKAILGQGFINLFTPIIKAINTLMAKLMVLAEYFRTFTEWITGKKSESTNLGSVATEVADATSGMTDATNGMADSASSATDSAKALKRELMGFDKITKLSDDSSSSSGSTGGSSSGSTGGIGSIGGSLTEVSNSLETQTNTMIANIKSAVLELADIVKSGFLNGLATDFDKTTNSIVTSLKSIGSSLFDIFTDEKVLSASDSWAKTTIYNLSSVAGSITSIGLSVADGLLGGFADGLAERKDSLKDWLINMLDVNKQTSTIVTDFTNALAEIATVCEGDNFKSSVSNITQTFSIAFENTTLLASKLSRDLLYYVTSPFTENKDEIKKSIDGALEPLSSITGTIKTELEKIGGIIQDVYDDKIKPTVDRIASVNSDLFGNMFESFDKHIKPVLDKIADRFNEVMENHVTPAIDEVVTAFGNVYECVADVYEIVKPVLEKIGEGIIWLGSVALDSIGESFMNAFENISDQIGIVFGTLSDLIEFVKSVFVGDWEKAWDAIKRPFERTWEYISKGLPDIEMPKFPDLKAGLSSAWDSCIDWWDNKKKALSDVSAKVSAYVATKWSDLQTAWNNLTNNVKDVTRSFKAKVGTTWANIKDSWNALTNNVKDVTRSFKAKIGTTWNNIKSAWGNLTGNVKDKTASFKAKVNTLSSTIASGWRRLSDQFKDKTADFKVKLSTAVGDVKNFVNSIIKAVNDKLIAKLDFEIKAPNWLGGGTFGWKAPKIPMLAQGGYVKANTPQLAVIGDNRHQGEVVAPEDKLLEMALKAGQIASQNSNTARMESLLETLISVVQSKDNSVYLDGEMIKRNVVNRLNNVTRSTGKCEIII